jgi:V8-like Glu-specific endopeptidase
MKTSKQFLLGLSIILFFLFSNRNYSQCTNVTEGRNVLINAATMKAPLSYIAHIFPKRGKTYSGTAFFIHPQVMLTAGHNVRKRKGFIFTSVKEIDLNIGATDCTTQLTKDFVVTTQNDNIISGNDEKKYTVQDDWGFIILNNTNANKVVGGVFAIEVFNPNKDYGVLYKCGYPSGEPQCVPRYDQTTNYNYDKSCDCLRYDFETEHGDSGAPIWYLNNGVPTVIAIHTNGDSKPDKNGKYDCGKGTLITTEVYQQLQAFCKAKGIIIP